MFYEFLKVNYFFNFLSLKNLKFFKKYLKKKQNGKYIKFFNFNFLLSGLKLQKYRSI